jgi:hypothetical protein
VRERQAAADINHAIEDGAFRGQRRSWAPASPLQPRRRVRRTRCRRERSGRQGPRHRRKRMSMLPALSGCQKASYPSDAVDRARAPSRPRLAGLSQSPWGAQKRSRCKSLGLHIRPSLCTPRDSAWLCGRGGKRTRTRDLWRDRPSRARRGPATSASQHAHRLDRVARGRLWNESDDAVRSAMTSRVSSRPSIVTRRAALDLGIVPIVARAK